MDHERFKKAMTTLYSVVHEFEEMFPGRPFTPDGHLVGSLGECLVADAYCLTLMPPSNDGYDAIDPTGKKVEIKATQARKVAFRSKPEHCIVIQIQKDGSFKEQYNGPGEKIWATFEGKPVPKNGQYPISLFQLAKLQETVPEQNKIPSLFKE